MRVLPYLSGFARVRLGWMRAFPVVAVAGALLGACAAPAGPTTPHAPDPSAPRLALGDSPRLGSPTAAIAIVEFSDYQCFYCQGFHAREFPRLKQMYVDTGVVQYIHKDFPLVKIHTQAVPAAIAARCAGAQGRFWEMRHELYVNTKLNDGLYLSLAKTLGLDVTAFRTCLVDPAPRHAIYRDVGDGVNLGVDSTPTFLLGTIEGDTIKIARVAKGTPEFEIFAREIEALRKP